MDSRPETYKHIQIVQKALNKVIIDLIQRAERHDQSKLKNPELEYFDIYTEKLAKSTYGSEEYNQFLQELKPALNHHYSNNSHHPEYYQNGIQGMSLLDLIEMICDWFAATKRHNDGDIRKSIDINQKRFGYSDELKSVFLNSLSVIEDEDLSKNKLAV